MGAAGAQAPPGTCRPSPGGKWPRMGSPLQGMVRPLVEKGRGTEAESLERKLQK